MEEKHHRAICFSAPCGYRYSAGKDQRKRFIGPEQQQQEESKMTSSQPYDLCAHRLLYLQTNEGQHLLLFKWPSGAPLFADKHPEQVVRWVYSVEELGQAVEAGKRLGSMYYSTEIGHPLYASCRLRRDRFARRIFRACGKRMEW